MKKKAYVFLYAFIFSIILISDRLTKSLAISNKFSNYKVFNFLSFDLTFNRGVSWGFLNSPSPSVFGFVSLMVISLTIVLVFYAREKWKTNVSILGEVLAIAGSFSNILDRVFYSGVADFIVFHFGKFYWPAFNIADSCIVAGIFLIIADSWVEK